MVGVERKETTVPPHPHPQMTSLEWEMSRQVERGCFWNTLATLYYLNRAEVSSLSAFQNTPQRGKISSPGEDLGELWFAKRSTSHCLRLPVPAQHWPPEVEL